MKPKMKNVQTYWLLLGGLGALTLLACASFVLTWGIMRVFGDEVRTHIADLGGANSEPGAQPSPTLFPTAEPPPPTATSTLPPTQTSTPIPTLTPPPVSAYDFQDAPNLDHRYISSAARTDLERLLAAVYPARDYYENEVRLGSSKLRERTVTRATYQLGDHRYFYTNGEQISTRLVYSSERAYFWVDDRINLTAADLRPVAARLDRELYPQVTARFGSEPGLGIDNQLPFHIVHLAELDTEELGYFDSSDQYPVEIFSYSNEVDALYLNMDELVVGQRLYYGTLVHELQHLVHWLNDSNETTWLDEGLAQVAEVMTDLDTFTVIDYLERPDMQVNSWSLEEDQVYAHYAAAALFSIYFWEQLGDDALRDLAQSPADGLAAVNAVLKKYRPGTTLDQFVGDWYAANYIRSPYPNRYGYRYRFAQMRPSVILREPGVETMALDQYGVRYIEIERQGNFLLSFAGDTGVDLIDAPAHSGQKVWLAPPVNGMAASLTRSFDLRGVSDANLSFWTWYDLESDFDYAYVTISNNGGRNWTVLQTERGVGSPFGSGLSGRSRDAQDQEDGWVREEISLRHYVGQNVLIRFEVLTDAAVAGRGMALDDFAIPEIDFFDDGESADGGWTAAGFVQTGTMLPQLWSLQLVTRGANPQVTPLVLDDYNQGQWRLELHETTTLVVAPVTPFNQEEARYWFKIEQLP